MILFWIDCTNDVPHVDQVRDVVAPVEEGPVHEVLGVLDEHLLEDLGAGGGDDGVGAAVPAHDPPPHPAHLLSKLLHPVPICLEVILHYDIIQHILSLTCLADN